MSTACSVLSLVRALPDLFAALAALAAGGGIAREEPALYLVRDVAVVDVEAGEIMPGRSVLLADGHISRVAPAAEIGEPPPGTTLVEGGGLFLLPGLFDAHVHVTAAPDTFPQLLVAHGVTAVRDTGAETDTILEMRASAGDGALIPRIVCTGAIVDGDPAFWPFSRPCDEPEEARAAVRELAEAGVDQIKVYSFLQKDVYEAAVEEAHGLGLKVTGHVPARVTLEEALAAGQDCNEHLMGFDRALARLLGREPPEELDPFRGEFDAWLEWDQVEPEALAGLLAEVREAGMVQCPTLVVMQGIARAADPESALEDPRMAYVPASLKSFWSSAGYVEFGRAAGKVVGPLRALVGELHRAGVPLLVGTDLANPYVFAGSSVHDEMRLFQEAGIPPADVLRAATIAPARFCGLESEVGTVAEGKEASLVLLRGNPLEDVAHVAEVEAVFLRGRYLPRERLDALLVEVAERVEATQPTEEAGEVSLELEGEIVERGRYRSKFGQFDAGVEEFVLVRDEQGYRLRAHSQPKGSPQPPFVLDYRTDSERRFVSARWQQLTNEAIVADYARAVDEIHVEARQGEKTFTQVFELPPDAVISAPAYASEFATVAAAGLEPGETRTFQSVGFGFGVPPWKLGTTDYTLTRHADTQLTLEDGGELLVQHYAYSMTFPFGEFEGESWIDERGVLRRSVLVMPFGTLTAELETEG